MWWLGNSLDGRGSHRLGCLGCCCCLFHLGWQGFRVVLIELGLGWMSLVLARGAVVCVFVKGNDCIVL